MELIQPHLEFLLRHLLTVVFAVFVIEAAGVPFPSRIVLLIAAAMAPDLRQVVTLVLVSTAGSLIGDHVPYLAGALTRRASCVLLLDHAGLSGVRREDHRYFNASGRPRCYSVASRPASAVRLRSVGCGHIAYGKFVSWMSSERCSTTAFWTTVG